MGDLLAAARLAGMGAAEVRAAAFAANDMEEFIYMIHRRIEAAAATPSAAADEDQQRPQEEEEETDEFLELELMSLRDMEQAHEEFHLHPRFDAAGGGGDSTNSTAPMEGAVDAWGEDDMLADLDDLLLEHIKGVDAAAATPSAAAESSPMEDDAAAATDEDQQRPQDEEETDEFLELELMFLRDMEQAPEEFHFHPRFDAGSGGGGSDSTNSSAPSEGAVDAWGEDDLMDLDDLILEHIKGVDAAARGDAGVVAPPPLDLELRL